MFVSRLKFVCFYTSEWAEGQVTEYLVATFGDYFSDVKMYVSLFYSGDAIYFFQCSDTLKKFMLFELKLFMNL